MASVTADTTDDVGSKIALLWAVILAVTDLTTYRMVSGVSTCKVRANLTILASLVLVVTEGAVQGGELTELVPLQLVLTLGD